MSRARPLADLLGRNGGEFQRIIDRGRALAQLDRRVRGYLAPELARHCRVANLRGGVLLLHCEAGAWATRLRYESALLLRMLRREKGLENLAEISVRVRPPEAPRAPRRPARLTDEGAAALRSAADAIEDPALSAALRRLASRHRR